MDAATAVGKNPTDVETHHFSVGHVVGEQRQHLVVIGMSTYGNDRPAIDEVEVQIGNLHTFSVILDGRQNGDVLDDDVETLGHATVLKESIVVDH